MLMNSVRRDLRSRLHGVRSGNAPRSLASGNPEGLRCPKDGAFALVKVNGKKFLFR